MPNDDFGPSWSARTEEQNVIVAVKDGRDEFRITLSELMATGCQFVAQLLDRTDEWPMHGFVSWCGEGFIVVHQDTDNYTHQVSFLPGRLPSFDRSPGALPDSTDLRYVTVVIARSMNEGVLGAW
jgi:hypothetical protein